MAIKKEYCGSKKRNEIKKIKETHQVNAVHVAEFGIDAAVRRENSIDIRLLVPVLGASKLGLASEKAVLLIVAPT